MLVLLPILCPTRTFCTIPVAANNVGNQYWCEARSLKMEPGLILPGQCTSRGTHRSFQSTESHRPIHAKTLA